MMCPISQKDYQLAELNAELAEAQAYLASVRILLASMSEEEREKCSAGIIADLRERIVRINDKVSVITTAMEISKQ